LAGTPFLAVDARDATPLPPDAVAAAAAQLAALPCPSVAIAGAVADRARQSLLAAFDVVVAGADELAAVATGIERAPLAAATLVQVLRANATLGDAAALAVESMAYGALQAGPEHARWLAARPPRRVDVTAAASVVEVHRAPGALIVTLARPERHNAYSARMRDGLAAALGLAAHEPELAVLLRGAGPSFCSGGDLDEFGTRPDPATAHLVRTTRSPARLLAALRDRVEVELHGACIGAGIELAAWARWARATPDAFFQLPEVGMGLVPGAGGTVSLPRRIGRQRTAALALSGRRLDAATALAWGLVDAVAPTPG
jgi:enoyl-CoA hydratase